MKKIISTVFIFRIIGAISLLFMTLVVSRVLSIEESGIYFLAFNIILILSIFNLFGTDNLILRFNGSNFKEHNWIAIRNISLSALKIMLLFSIISCTALWIASGFISTVFLRRPELEEVIKVSSVITFFTSVNILFAYNLQAIRKTSLSIFILYIPIPLILTVSIYIKKYTSALDVLYLLLIITMLTSFLSFSIWNLRLTRELRNSKSHTNNKPNEKNLLVKTCIPLWISASMGIIILWGSQIIAAFWLSNDDIAYYSVAQRLANSISFALIVVNAFAAPRFAAYYASGEIDRISTLAQSMLKVTISIAVIPVGIIIIFPNIIMSFFGDGYIAGTIPLLILSIGQAINVATGSVSYLLNMTGHEKDLRNILIITAALTILLTSILTPFFGINGTAIAAAFGISFQNIFASIVVKRRLGINMLVLSSSRRKDEIK